MKLKSETYQIGDIVEGTVSKVEEKHALIDFGYKIDGILPIGEISNIHIEKVADVLLLVIKLELKVIKVTEDDIVLSKRAVENEKAWDSLARNWPLVKCLR